MDKFGTSHQTAALVLRVFGTLFAGTFVVIGIYLYSIIFFLYLTDWGLFLTFLIFGLILFRSYHSCVSSAAETLLPIIWILNAAITIGFWCVVFPINPTTENLELSILMHGPPFILTSLEIWWNQVPIKRIDMWIALVIELVYTFGINMPYTLTVDDVYPGIDFLTFYSYLGVGLISLTCLVAGECGFRGKRKLLKSRAEAVESDLRGNLLEKS